MRLPGLEEQRGDAVLFYKGSTPDPRTSAQSVMSNPMNTKPDAPESTPATEPEESFQDIFSQYEKSHARKPEGGPQSREGTVIALTADAIIIDIGFKSEGLLPLAEMHSAPVKPGDKLA